MVKNKTDITCPQTKEELQRKLKDLYLTEPKRPFIPNILLIDITYERLLKLLGDEYPSCLLASSEGALILGSRSMGKDNVQIMLGALNALWSGERLRSHRKTTESAEVKSGRLSVSIAIQPEVFSAFLKANTVARNIGFLARFLFSHPESTQGTRFLKKASPDAKHMEVYKERVLAIFRLNLPLTDRRLNPATIGLSTEAEPVWTDFFNEIEIELRAKGLYCSVRDIASKAAENAARVAAVLQAAKGFPISEIDEDSMRSACTIVCWHLNEALIYFGVVSDEVIKLAKDAQKLADWLIALSRNTGENRWKRSFVNAHGPSSLRKPEIFKPTLEKLSECGIIFQHVDDRTIELNPLLAAYPE